ncbi:MAG: amidohydrolase [Pseudomonadota bacterium]
MTTVFKAARVLTMDHNIPEATHVAVRDGVVLAVGGPDCAAGWGPYTVDDRFADHVLMPGLIEAHAHVSAGGVWRNTYCGHYARTDPDGKVWEGAPTAEALIERLRAVAATTPEGEPVIGWGFDPNFLPGRRLDKEHLDQVSTKHKVLVIHSNFHLATANSRTLEAAGISRDTNTIGVTRGPDGAPNGELQEFAAMAPAMQATGAAFGDLSDEAAVRNYGKIARNCGVTTVADLLSDLYDDEVAMLSRVTGEASFPARYVPIMNAMQGAPEEEAARAVALRAHSTDKLFLGRAKLFTDGAIQGGTALLKAPGYYQMEDNGMWNMEPEHFRAAVLALHRAGVKTHVHTNGDAASEAAIDAYRAAMLASPNPDLRHTLEHVQLADLSQFTRMRALGLTVNVFANHIHYFGDIHYTKSLGPERAERIDACADAWAVFGADFAIHSDAPVTPMAPLVTAWAAVTRQTESGRILGRNQRITVGQALRNITMGAAYVLGLEDQVGSITVGKRADFCVLDRDPLSVEPAALRDVVPLATVLGGEVTQ